MGIIERHAKCGARPVPVPRSQSARGGRCRSPDRVRPWSAREWVRCPPRRDLPARPPRAASRRRRRRRRRRGGGLHRLACCGRDVAPAFCRRRQGVQPLAGVAFTEHRSGVVLIGGRSTVPVRPPCCRHVRRHRRTRHRPSRSGRRRGPPRRFRSVANATSPTSTSTGTMASNHHQLHSNHLLPLESEACALLGALGASCPGTCKPDSSDARLDGSVLKVFFERSQEITPPLNRCVMTSPFSVWSAIGAPSSPFAPPNRSQAAFMAPRTITAP